MAEQEIDPAGRDGDPQVSRRYRELGRDEPPAALDAAIRAEARRALVMHAAPLVPPTGRRHWYFPVAAAAVIVLAVAVTSQVEREQSSDVRPAPPETALPAAPAMNREMRSDAPKPQAGARAKA